VSSMNPANDSRTLNATEFAFVAALAAKISVNVEQVIIGKRDRIELLLTTLFCEGHALLEDVPGVGKTTLAKAIARSIRGDFRRIQFTPDLLPSDIGGISYFNQKLSDFQFRPGPVFANLLLADEINRAAPRTQAAMLEAMEERSVTTDGETRILPRPFLVLATENPIELEGVFPLPEAQLDRFLMRIDLGYPTHDEEDEILERHHQVSPLENLEAVSTTDELLRAANQTRLVFVSPEVRHYLTGIVRATRVHESVELGASPRASLALHRAAQALAAIRGRDHVQPEDVKFLAPAVLGHRIIVGGDARIRGRDTASVLADVLASVPAPVEGEIGFATAR